MIKLSTVQVTKEAKGQTFMEPPRLHLPAVLSAQLMQAGSRGALGAVIDNVIDKLIEICKKTLTIVI